MNHYIFNNKQDFTLQKVMKETNIEPLIVLGIKTAGNGKLNAIIVKSTLPIDATIQILKSATSKLKKDACDLPF